MSVQKGEGKKRASDCVTRCCRHAPAVLAFTKEKTRIVPRGSMVHWNFNEIFAFAIGWSEKGIDSKRENRPFFLATKTIQRASISSTSIYSSMDHSVENRRS